MNELLYNIADLWRANNYGTIKIDDSKTGYYLFADSNQNSPYHIHLFPGNNERGVASKKELIKNGFSKNGKPIYKEMHTPLVSNIFDLPSEYEYDIITEQIYDASGYREYKKNQNKGGGIKRKSTRRNAKKNKSRKRK
jgi:hypothetical protein